MQNFSAKIVAGEAELVKALGEALCWPPIPEGVAVLVSNICAQEVGHPRRRSRHWPSSRNLHPCRRSWWQKGVALRNSPPVHDAAASLCDRFS